MPKPTPAEMRPATRPALADQLAGRAHIETAARLVAGGLPMTAAAERMGVHVDTLRRWLASNPDVLAQAVKDIAPGGVEILGHLLPDAVDTLALELERAQSPDASQTDRITGHNAAVKVIEYLLGKPVQPSTQTSTEEKHVLIGVYSRIELPEKEPIVIDAPPAAGLSS